ncbi:putative chorismate pyruvate-lyase [Betaproteobacteria bacterium]|nr:putative chorismate pyruvate-lyase [Betaproteobacteria bacterium]GHU46307.1 putative chorismate pyruvate-lyase [Betaproteobacteria bacterium]
MNWQTHLMAAAPARSLLQEQGSLTLRLARACHHFVVHCLCQRAAPLSPDEADCLELRAGQMVWERDVLLLTDGRPAVFAHTVMPCCPRHPFDRSFAALQNQSLGKILFSDPRILRGKLEFRRLDRRDALYRRACLALKNHAPVAPLPALLPPPRLWARRSRFNRQAKGVLVTEVFLPTAPFAPLTGMKS